MPRITTVHFIFSDYYQTVVCTAITHIFMEQLKWQRNSDLEKVYVHAFLDGRDTPPCIRQQIILEQLVEKMKEIGVGEDCYRFRTLLCNGQR